ncbi:MAG: DUF4364 family protein [Firmicutes bacterium]|nr:DUF4364 family protein [Bacillota bacterium]
MFDSTEDLAQNKLTILYLLNQLGIAVSGGELCQFAIENDFMDYFSVQQYLSELSEAGLTDKFRDKNTTWYRITPKGNDTLELFVRNIPIWIQRETKIYIIRNSARLKAEFETDATLTPLPGHSFRVDCFLFDHDHNPLFKLELISNSRKKAEKIQKNWRDNFNSIYPQLIKLLSGEDEEKKEPPRDFDGLKCR